MLQKEELLCYSISTQPWNTIYSNMEAANPNKNLRAILSSIITLHIGHNFLFRGKKKKNHSKTLSPWFFFCPKISVVGFDVGLSGIF